MESVIEHLLPPRHASRAAHARLAVVLALLVCAPVATAPTPAAAAVPPAPPPVRADLPAPKAQEDAGPPSIQYEQALEHAADKIDFEPGARVSVPFKPRDGDGWQVDGKAPRELPPGHATGLQMRATPNVAVWAAGAPADLASPRAAEGEGSVEPASYVTSGTGAPIDGAQISSTGLRREVFGFLPYWEVGASTTVLDWRTLSTVAYFSVGCTSTGGLDKTDADGSLSTGWAGWTSSKMTSIINAAHQNHTRVVLTISCFAWSSSGASRQASLLGSATARSTLAKAAAAAVRDRGADGINLDFEPIVSGYADEFTALVRSVRSELNRIAAGYQLTFDTMGSIGNQPIAEATAPGGADAVFIMGYDYRTDGSSVAGSHSPLTGPRYDLTDTVKAYMAKIPPSKIILGVPYYGRAWSTSSSALNASTLSPSKYGAPAAPNYSQAADLVTQYGRRWDSVEQSPWTAYKKQTCTATYGCVTSWRELYYDDAASLKLRYDLINRSSLRGTGIWALGYDGTRPELRQALADKFLADKTAPVVGVSTLAQQQRDEGFRVGWSSWDDSTVTGYDVQVSIDGGIWTAWLTGTTATSSIYLGRDGHTYAFRIRATDIHGNVSGWYAAISTSATGVPADLEIGGFATVLVDGLRMRSNPATDGSVMVTLSAGDALRILAGPVSGEGYSWYQVAGPVKQWAPVDAMQVGGWVAASGNGETNAGPRRPVYATRVVAGITDLILNAGGPRFLTPNGDDDHDTVRLTWMNHRTFDSISLRVYRTDGTLAGAVGLGSASTGAHAYEWDGRIGGIRVPDGAYVLQLQGIDGSSTFSAPSASPVSATQIARLGVMVGNAAPTSVLSFRSTPPSPTRSTTISFGLTFGGPIAGLTGSDVTRTGTATGCALGSPTGSGASWSIRLTGCSAGTVQLGLRAGAVVDAVGNTGPSTQFSASPLIIDRTAPSTSAPRATLRAGAALGSVSPSAALPASLVWSGSDSGGAGLVAYDVARAIDGGGWAIIAAGLGSPALATTLTPGHAYQYEVRARDRAGNVGSWVRGPVIRAYLPQQSSSSITWKGAWGNVTDPRYSGGSMRYSGAAGATATYTFTGRAIAWVTTLHPSGGAAKVYLDGTLVATVDTYSASSRYLYVVYSRTWASSGTHTLRIVVVGTVSRPRVFLDALEVLR